MLHSVTEHIEGPMETVSSSFPDATDCVPCLKHNLGRRLNPTLKIYTCSLIRMCDKDKSRTHKVRRINNTHKRKGSLKIERNYYARMRMRVRIRPNQNSKIYKALIYMHVY